MGNRPPSLTGLRRRDWGRCIMDNSCILSIAMFHPHKHFLPVSDLCFLHPVIKKTFHPVRSFLFLLRNIMKFRPVFFHIIQFKRTGIFSYQLVPSQPDPAVALMLPENRPCPSPLLPVPGKSGKACRKAFSLEGKQSLSFLLPGVLSPPPAPEGLERYQ